jgi:hypothetical protein
VRESAVLRGGVRNGRSQTEMVRCVWCGLGSAVCGESNGGLGTGIVLDVLCS